MSKGSRTDLCGGWPERAIPTATVGVSNTVTYLRPGTSSMSVAKRR